MHMHQKQMELMNSMGMMNPMMMGMGMPPGGMGGGMDPYGGMGGPGMGGMGMPGMFGPPGGIWARSKKLSSYKGNQSYKFNIYNSI